MNVWAIEKDMPLKVLLLELVHRYGEKRLFLNEQENNFKAIEIHTEQDSKLAAYVFTFAQQSGCYGIDLKYPIRAHDIIGDNENLSLEKTIDIIETHLFS
jgi:hypothetical protein